MTWADFVAEVNAQLSVDANRRGLEAFRNRFTRNAIIDLQRFIPGYRVGHTTTYAIGDAQRIDQASLVSLPSGAKPKEFWLYSTDLANPNLDSYCQRSRLDFYPWASRQDLVCGRMDFTTWALGCCGSACNAASLPANCQAWNWGCGKAYVYTMAPNGRTAMVYPQINAANALLLIWNGLKSDFADIDTVPWPDEAAEAVAAYVKWRVVLDVDKNPSLAREHYSFYKERRLSLFRDWQEGQDAEGDGDEYNVDAVAPAAVAGMQQGTVALAAGATSSTIVFGVAFAAVPQVGVWLTDPSGAAYQMNAYVDSTTLTINGFTALFVGTIPAAGWTLHWNAIPAQP